MRELGPIVLLQVQRSGLKNPAPTGAAVARRFDPAPLLGVPALRLTPDGVLGLIDGQQPIVDVHHTDHDDTRNVVVNGVSIGFTGHYAALAGRFGSHLPLGVAGENVIVGRDAIVDEAAVAAGLAIRTAAGELVRLHQVHAAEPCVEFTRFALRMGDADPSNQDVTEGLRFLRAGIRGFYASYAGADVTVRAGDVVFALD
jgi:hypothetical protein